jgi:cytochrome c-type biogenesis protein CcsB
MRVVYLVVAGLLLSSLPLRAEPATTASYNWGRLRDLPVLNGGRHKPLDTLAWETFRLISNRTGCTDPETGAKLDAVGLYLTLILDWQGWEHEQRDRLLLLTDWRPLYFSYHKPDKWDEAPLLRIDYLALRTALGLEKDQAWISPVVLNKATIEDPRTGKNIPFTAWASQLERAEGQGKSLGNFEKKGLELANKLWAYQDLRMGRGLEILPSAGDPAGEWMPLAHLILTRFTDENDPTGAYRQVQAQLQTIATAYHAGDVATCNAALAEFVAGVRALGAESDSYPGTTKMRLEVAYNQGSPFRIAWIGVLAAAVCMLLHLGSGWKSFHVAALAGYGLGLAGLLAGFILRVAISGRPPVTNMYESVIYVGFGVAVLGLIFEVIYRAKYILLAAAAVSTVALILADNSPTILDPAVRPLEPVLRSNFWLVTHVMTITLSYAAFALALGIANITLGYFLVGSSNRTTISALSRFTYKAMQVGVLLLAAGVILGGVWADYSWGRFWGWDPKEVWALVALLGYLCVLHARFLGWVGQRGLAALSVVCFSLVVMAWYGVNFVLGAGLHSYGFGGGGQGWVYAAVALQLLYAAGAVWRSRVRPLAEHGRAVSATGGDEVPELASTPA